MASKLDNRSTSEHSILVHRQLTMFYEEQVRFDEEKVRAILDRKET